MFLYMFHHLTVVHRHASSIELANGLGDPIARMWPAAGSLGVYSSNAFAGAPAEKKAWNDPSALRLFKIALDYRREPVNYMQL